MKNRAEKDIKMKTFDRKQGRGEQHTIQEGKLDTYKKRKTSEVNPQEFSVVVERMKKTSLRLGHSNTCNYIKPVTTITQKAKHCQSGNKKDNETIWFEF